MSTSLPPLGADRASPPVAPQPAAAKALEPVAQPARAAQPDARAANAAQARPTREQLEQALNEVNQRMQSNGRSLAFSLDEKADRLVIKVTNAKTGEVVRQIPDETILRIAHSLEELKGALYDESA